MTQVGKQALTWIGWSLVIAGPVLLVWALLEVVTGSMSFMGGGPLFAARTILGWVVGYLTPTALGALLLVAIRIYERVGEGGR